MDPPQAAESFRSLVLRGRGRTGLVQLDLAVRAGVSRRSVQDWEAGVTLPTAERLQALIRALLQAGGLTSGRESFEARELLLSIGVDIPVLHLLRLTNFPGAEIAKALVGADNLIAIEDHCEFGGLADIMRREFPEKTVTSIAWPQGWTGASGDSGVLRAACGIDTERVFERCLRAAGKTISPIAAVR